MKPALLVLLFLCVAIQLAAQPAATEIPTITVRGTVYDVADSLARPGPIVINKRTGTGQAASGGGIFSITGLKTDTFMITAGGYEVVRLCFNDSVLKTPYTVRVGLRMRANYMNPVTVFPVKDLGEIKKERESLGVEQTRTTEGITDAVASPITYFWERYSQEGQSRTAVAEMENRDRMNDILKELFRAYVRAGVIDLKEEEFDNFILYLNLPEAYLRTASDYELASTIRIRYLQYREAQRIHDSNQH
jgi:hypothetical protein